MQLEDLTESQSKRMWHYKSKGKQVIDVKYEPPKAPGFFNKGRPGQFVIRLNDIDYGYGGYINNWKKSNTLTLEEWDEAGGLMLTSENNIIREVGQRILSIIEEKGLQP